MAKKTRSNGAAGFSPPKPDGGLKPAAPRNPARWLIGAGALVVLAVVIVAALRMRSTPADQPDVILVTIDTLRWDCLTFANPKSKVQTPYLDELARGGIYFSNAHAHNIITFPSHTNILTGLLPFQHGVRDNAGFTLDPKHHTIAKVLKEHGYATGAFVGAFPLDARFGLNPDFDVYDDKYHEGTAPSAFIVPERPANETLAAAQQWYDSLPDQKKFMWVHLYEPHAPYAPRSPFKEQYPNDPYFGEVASADDYLANFLRPILEKKPNTFVIVTADHGEGMGEHGEVTHGLFAYEETLKIPLIVYEKDRVKPHVEKSYARHIDIAPTILARLGIKKPEELRGGSLLDMNAPRDTYFESLTSSLNLGWAPLVGMIHEEHKYVDLPLAELYDLARDPGETKNILRDDRRMTTKIRQLMAHAAPAPDLNVERNISADEAQKLMSLGYLTGTAAAKKTYTAADDPKNLVTFFSRMNHAVSLYQGNKWDEALDVAQKLLKERPEMSMARDLVAFMLQQTEHNDQAEAFLREEIAKGEADETMKKRLGLLLSEKGEASEAVQILSQFAGSKDPDLLNAYGIALADMGRYPEAIQQFQQALKVDHTNATAFQNMGVVALRTNDLPTAKQYLGRALQLNAKMPLALNTMGVVYARENDFPRAMEAWRNAVALDPRQYDAFFNLGLIAGRTGQRDEARKALTQFVKTAPRQRYADDIRTAQQALIALQ